MSAANNGNGDGNNTINASADDDADSMMLIGRVHVYSPDDLLSDNGDLNRTATNDLLDPLQSFVSSGNTVLPIYYRWRFITVAVPPLLFFFQLPIYDYFARSKQISFNNEYSRDVCVPRIKRLVRAIFWNSTLL